MENYNSTVTNGKVTFRPVYRGIYWTGSRLYGNVWTVKASHGNKRYIVAGMVIKGKQFRRPRVEGGIFIMVV